MIGRNNIAAMAKVFFVSRILISSIVQESAFALIEALCAKPMRWFSTAVSLCNRVNHSSAPRGVQFIAALLIIPCFKASNFFLEICYFCMRRRELLLKLKIARVNGEEFFVKNIELFDNSRACLQLKKRLDDIACVVISGKGGGSKKNWVSHELLSLNMDIRSCKAALGRLQTPLTLPITGRRRRSG